MSGQEHQFDWNYARAFLLTVEKGSFSAAARELGLAQPTLGRQVASLEKQLGVTLFERVGQSLEITEAGASLVKHVQVMGDAASQMSIIASGQSQALEGLVTISASEVEAVFLLPTIIAKINRDYPQIKIDIHVSSDIANLKRREADIALRSFRPTEPDLIIKKVREDRIWFYGTPQYLSTFKNAKSQAELSALQIIGFEQGSRMLEMLNANGWNFTDKNLSYSTMSQSLQWQLVKQNVGVGFFPEVIADKEPAFVKAFEQFGSPISIPIWLVTHRELHTSQKVRKVYDLIWDMMSKIDSIKSL